MGISLGHYIWKKEHESYFQEKGIHPLKAFILKKIQCVTVSDQSDSDLSAMPWHIELK